MAILLSAESRKTLLHIISTYPLPWTGVKHSWKNTYNLHSKHHTDFLTEEGGSRFFQKVLKTRYHNLEDPNLKIIYFI